MADASNHNLHITLTLEVKKDLHMWLEFLDEYKGVFFIQHPIDHSNYDVEFWSDAA